MNLTLEKDIHPLSPNYFLMSNPYDIQQLLAETRDEWCIRQTAYDPTEEDGWETLLTLCNGYVGVRGAVEVASAGQAPATYFAGVFDKPDLAAPAKAYGLMLKNKAITPALAITPTWNGLELEIGGEAVDFLNAEVIEFTRTLDLARGVVISGYAFKDRAGRITALRTLTMVSKADLHLALLQVEVEARNYAAPVTLRFVTAQETVPGTIPRLRDYISPTEVVARGEEDGTAYLHSRVTETGVEVAVAGCTHGPGPAVIERRQHAVCERFTVDLAPGQRAAFSKRTAFFTSLDGAPPLSAALDHLRALREMPDDALLDAHFAYWQQRWAVADVAFSGDAETLAGVRWDIFNLLQMGNPENPNVSISATGLHGQGYFGHVFWDTEVYLVPFYLAVEPAVARNLLLYRYHRLGAAKQNAIDWGYQGARFPWTSTWQGYDVTPPDWGSSRELHISGAVALGFQLYLRWTGDEAFYRQYGIEVIVETAIFWASKVELGEDGLCHLNDIVGPDEYNMVAPDNYYTNHLACWNMRQAVEAMDELAQADPALYAAITEHSGWNAGLRERISEITARMAFPRIRDGVCEQHRGFFDLPDAVITKRGPFNMPIIESYSYNTSSQRSKQADVVMLHFLFEDDFDPAVKRASYEYYNDRCTQGSSLSPAIYAVMGLKVGLPEHAYGYFQLTALLDLHNLHLDKNLREGIHAACAGGTWMAAVYGYGGVAVQRDTLVIAPKLPAQWPDLTFAFRFRDRLLRVCADTEQVTVTLEAGEALEVLLYEERVLLQPGSTGIAHMSLALSAESH